MEHISRPMLEVVGDLAALLEARELNRVRLRQALARGAFSAWPALEQHHREILAACEEPEPGAHLEAPPEGLSPAGEVLWRIRHLRRLGCPRGDLEGLIGLFCAAAGLDFVEVAGFIFGKGELLNVDA